jgi:hypothetical protein
MSPCEGATNPLLGPEPPSRLNDAFNSRSPASGKQHMDMPKLLYILPMTARVVKGAM